MTTLVSDGPLKARADATMALLSAWKSEGIRYAILHGLHADGTLGRDLDVFLHREDQDRAFGRAEEIFGGAGFACGYLPALRGRTLVAARREWESAMEIHALTEVSWRSVCFTDSPKPDFELRSFPVDSWAMFSKTIILPLLAGKKRPVSEAVEALGRERIADLASSLANIFGPENGPQFLALLFAQPQPDNEGLFAVAPELRRSAVQRSFRQHGWRAYLRGSEAVCRKLVQRFSRFGLIVAIAGPDGVGKSTVIRLLEEGSHSIFTGIVTRHWRPGVLANLGRYLGKDSKIDPSTGTIAPRRSAGSLPAVRAFYYLIDYLLGHWIKDRPAVGTQKLVLYDRSALDMAVDPLRFGLPNSRYGAWICQLSPSPDLVVLFEDTPERIFARKPELDLPELRRQQSEWRRYVPDSPRSVILPVDASAETMCERMREAILAALLQRLKRNSSL